MNYDAIIIGAGLGGLTAAAKLAKSGKKILLVEQHSVPGGCATTFKRKDFTIEVGLHELDGFGDNDLKSSIFNEFNIFENVEFIQLPEFYRTVWKNTEFVFPEGAEQAKTKLIKEFPHEEKGIIRYFNFITGLGTEIGILPRGKWAKIIKGALFPLFYPKLVKSTQITVGAFIDKIIKDERLKLILLSNLSYYDDDPYKLGLFYFAAGQASYYTSGSYFIKGGSQKLSDYLMKFIIDNGGEVKLRSKVKKIVTKNGKAAGVEYMHKINKKAEATHKLAYADIVIANTAIPNLTNGLLPEKEAEILNNQIKDLKGGPSILTLYLGFKSKLSQIGNKHYSTFVIDDSVKSINDMNENEHADFNKRSYVFVDYGIIDSELAPEGKSVGVVCTMDYYDDWTNLDKEAYKEKKETVKTTLINRLEKLLPGIKEQIEYSELATAKTIERYTLNPKGSPYGYAQTLNQTARNRIKQKSIIPGLYYASAWTSPGGGFTGAIYAGYLSALSVLKDIKKQKSND
ncbi:MAG: NAD(P)/FAD-dependent oxidoreductase [Bacteroidales bacterium]|nr:NAD(P)/FAD-dependent oxidoreductase [Bacteroidales bacterium]